MSNNYFYSNSIFDGVFDNQHQHRQYIALPVIRYSLILSCSVPPKLNHFERAILTLCLDKYRPAKEIADLLLLDVNLVKYIIDNLKQNALITPEHGTTPRGESLLKGVYEEIRTRAVYAFYDKNINRFLSEVVDAKEMNNTTSDGNFIKPQNEYEIMPIIGIRQIKFERSNNKLDFKSIKNLLSKELINIIDEDENLVNFEIVNQEEHGYLVTFIEPGSERGTVERWAVASPFDSTRNDIEIRDYLYEKSNNPTISNILAKILKEERNRVVKDTSHTIIEFVKNELFNKTISDDHEVLLEPLANILLESEDTFADRGAQIAEKKSLFALNLFELLENILYLSAKKYKFAYSREVRLNSNDVESNALKLISYAQQLGFYADKSTKNLLSVNYRAIKDCINKPKGRIIGPCVALNLMIAINQKEHFLRELSNVYPEFLIYIYRLKRTIRDKARHTIIDLSFDTTLLKELVLLLLDFALGYIVKEDKIKELNALQGEKTYSYSAEHIRSTFGNEFFDTDNKKIIVLRDNLITCYNLYLDKDANYINRLRSIVEQVFSDMLSMAIDKYHFELSEEPIDTIFDGNSSMSFFENIGFEIKPLLTNQEDIETPFKIKYNADNTIRSSMASHLKNINLSYKLTAFAVFLDNSEDYLNSFDFNEPPVQGLISLIIAIMFLDKGHNKNNEFEQDNADVLIQKSLETIAYIYKAALIDWR